MLGAAQQRRHRDRLAGRAERLAIPFVNPESSCADPRHERVQVVLPVDAG